MEDSIQRSNRILIITSALVFGALVGLVAAIFEPKADYAWLTGLAFGVIGFVAVGAIGWIIVSARLNPALARIENAESVEQLWVRRAASGAFFDLVIFVSLMTAFFSITRLDLPVQFALAGVIMLGLADLGVRHTVLAKRES